MNKTTPIESKDNYSWLDDVLSGYKLRDKILPIYRPLFDPTIGAEHLSHLLSQCTIEVLQVSNDLKQTIISQIRIERAEAIESFKKVNKILDREIEIEKLRARIDEALLFKQYFVGRTQAYANTRIEVLQQKLKELEGKK
jgi:hypothetical protein